jgi:hypothetical protein
MSQHLVKLSTPYASPWFPFCSGQCHNIMDNLGQEMKTFCKANGCVKNYKEGNLMVKSGTI